MKPILFNTEMVRAILDGRKTVTRRNPFHFEMKNGVSPTYSGLSLGEYFTGRIESGACLYTRGRHGVWGVVSNIVKPRYKVGDVLYVRETWKVSTALVGRDSSCEVEYRAGGSKKFNKIISIPSVKWHPSLHMPKSAARIFLKVTDVRIERLQEITPEQAVKEGISKFDEDEVRCVLDFWYLWDSTIKKSKLDQFGWFANPWVWVIEFERCEKPSDVCGGCGYEQCRCCE